MTGQTSIIGVYCQKYERIEPEEYSFEGKTITAVHDDQEGGGED